MEKFYIGVIGETNRIRMLFRSPFLQLLPKFCRQSFSQFSMWYSIWILFYTNLSVFAQSQKNFVIQLRMAVDCRTLHSNLIFCANFRFDKIFRARCTICWWKMVKHVVEKSIPYFQGPIWRFLEGLLFSRYRHSDFQISRFSRALGEVPKYRVWGKYP